MTDAGPFVVLVQVLDADDRTKTETLYLLKVRTEHLTADLKRAHRFPTRAAAERYAAAAGGTVLSWAAAVLRKTGGATA